jgi:RNA-directed DNA polymerase
LVFNEDKTQIVPIGESGFDFLGFSVRRYDGTLLIKPSTAAIQRIRERLRTEIRTRRGSSTAAILAVLTPIIRGWAAYYRGVVSSKTLADSLLPGHNPAQEARWASVGNRDMSHRFRR